MKQLFSVVLSLCVVFCGAGQLLAQELAPETSPTPSDVADGPVARDQSNVGSIAALGTIAFGGFAAGTSMLVASAATANKINSIDGDLLIDQERRSTLTLRKGSQQVLGATFLGIGALATTGFSILVARHLDGKRDRAELSAAPVFLRGGGGIQLNARF
jgi:hypothetical protein